MKKPTGSTLPPTPVVRLLAAATALLLASPGLAADGENLFEMPLEQLINLEVTSVSRRSERLAETTSAVYVVTREDILRYGIGSVPEALRLVPGLSVLQIDGNKWAVGSRGFTGRFANKLLVLMDGRVLYTPSFSGVFWDVQDTLLEDVARIEVIRGPGSALWGANAVNGVINIITRSAAEDPSRSLLTRVESDGGYTTAARVGWSGGEGASHRLTLKHQDATGHRAVDGGDTADEWNLSRVGWRSDWEASDRDTVSLTSEIYDGTVGQSFTRPTPTPPYLATTPMDTSVAGAFAIGTWTHRHSDRASTTAQLTLDATDRESIHFTEERDTYAADLQHQRSYARHELVVGAEYRTNSFEIPPSAFIELPFTTASYDSLSAFAQDQFALVPEKLELTFGTKIEHNELSNRKHDLMPTLRLLWQIDDDTSFWSAVTRAVRTPSYADLGARVLDIDPVVPAGVGAHPFPVPMRFAAVGSPDFVSEELLAYEVGLRGRFGASTSYDVSIYQMDYEQLRAYSPVGVFCNPSRQSVALNPLCLFSSDSVITEIGFNNEGTGEVHGVELSLDWDLSDHWRLRTSYAYSSEEQWTGYIPASDDTGPLRRRDPVARSRGVLARQRAAQLARHRPMATRRRRHESAAQRHSRIPIGAQRCGANGDRAARLPASGVALLTNASSLATTLVERPARRSRARRDDGGRACRDRHRARAQARADLQPHEVRDLAREPRVVTDLRAVRARGESVRIGARKRRRSHRQGATDHRATRFREDVYRRL
jgi:iron complex outermembrane receptor protein